MKIFSEVSLLLDEHDFITLRRQYRSTLRSYLNNLRPRVTHDLSQVGSSVELGVPERPTFPSLCGQFNHCSSAPVPGQPWSLQAGRGSVMDGRRLTGATLSQGQVRLPTILKHCLLRPLSVMSEIMFLATYLYLTQKNTDIVMFQAS